MEIAGGVVAVVSLSIQLADTVRKACGFLCRLRNASDEILLLIDKLDQLQFILRQVSDVVETQRQLRSPHEAIGAIQSAVCSCERNVKRLQLMVLRLKPKNRTHLTNRAILLSFKTAIKDEDIKKLRHRINEDLLMLQTALLINSTRLHLSHIQASAVTSLGGQLPSLMNATGSTQRHDGIMTIQNQKPKGLQNKPLLMSNETYSAVYRGIFGHAQIRRKVRYHQDDFTRHGEIISEETSIMIIPFFLNTAFIALYEGKCGRIPRTLRSCPVLSAYSPFFKMCREGNIEDFKNALSRREVSPYAISEYGWSLLHVASWGVQPDICLLLVQLGVDTNQMDQDGDNAFHAFHAGLRGSVDPRKDPADVLETLRILLTAQDDIVTGSWKRFFLNYGGPVEGADFVFSTYVSGIQFEEEQKIIDYALSNALRRSAEAELGWNGFIRRLLRRGADIHRTKYVPLYRSKKGHLLSHILRDVNTNDLVLQFTNLDRMLRCSHPFDADATVQRWLELLSAEGHDVATYCRDEGKLHQKQHSFTLFNHSYGCHRKLSFSYDEAASITLDWWIDPDSGAALVRNEFKYMIIQRQFSFSSWEDNVDWPLVYPSSSDHYECSHWWSEPPETDPGWIAWRRRHQLAQSRADRRYEKRRMKEARARGTYYPSRVPGSWVE